MSAPESESSGADASALDTAPSEELMRESKLGARRGGEQSSQSRSRPYRRCRWRQLSRIASERRGRCMVRARARLARDCARAPLSLSSRPEVDWWTPVFISIVVLHIVDIDRH